MTEPTPQKTPSQAKLSPPPATPPPTTPPPAIPPQQPGEIGGAEQQARWPKIIGIISIVLGVVGCLGGASGFLMPMFMEAMAKRVPSSQAGMFDNVQTWGNWIVIRSALAFAIGLLLLIAGIALVKRRRYGIKLARVWAVSKMLFAVVGSYVGYAMQQEQVEQMSQQMAQQNPGFNAAPVFGTMALVLVAIGFLWSCTFPTFVLIWFARRKVKAEYSQWS